MAFLKQLKQIGKDLQAGGQGFSKATEGLDYGLTFVPFTKASRKAYGNLKEQGITTKTPVKLAGALATSLVTDLGYDATRVLYWKNNHPMPISDSLSRLAQGKNINQYSAPQKAVIGLASVGIPVGASLGIYDLTNPGELFRPKGFAQSYAEQGTMENLQGEPEARIVGFPVGLQAVGALAGSSAATATALRSMPPGKVEKKGKGQTTVRPSAKRVPTAQVAAAGAGGALLGALAGKLMNRAIASQGQSDLPSTYEYDSQHVQALNTMLKEDQITKEQYQAML
jgi:hypothetical protein